MRPAHPFIFATVLLVAAASAGPNSVMGPYAGTSRSGKRPYVKGQYTRKQQSIFPQTKAAVDPVERRMRMKETHLPKVRTETERRHGMRDAR